MAAAMNLLDSLLVMVGGFALGWLIVTLLMERK
jgi:hypothetical protein